MGDNRDRIELRTTVVIFGSFPGFLGGDPEKDDASDYEVFDKNDPDDNVCKLHMSTPQEHRSLLQFLQWPKEGRVVSIDRRLSLLHFSALFHKSGGRQSKEASN
jgi:hypothetical protein